MCSSHSPLWLPPSSVNATANERLGGRTRRTSRRRPTFPDPDRRHDGHRARVPRPTQRDRLQHAILQRPDRQGRGARPPRASAGPTGSTATINSRSRAGSSMRRHPDTHARGRGVASVPTSVSRRSATSRRRCASGRRCLRGKGARARPALPPRSPWTRSRRSATRDRRRCRFCIREKQQRRPDYSYPACAAWLRGSVARWLTCLAWTLRRQLRAPARQRTRMTRCSSGSSGQHMGAVGSTIPGAERPDLS